MSIKMLCPNGHKLRVDERHAGQRATCPRCSARLTVPTPTRRELSESSIVALLGDTLPQQTVMTRVAPPPERPKRTCPKCQTVMSAAYHICPKCRVYLPDQPRLERTPQATCHQCGAPPMPSDSHCNTCGSELRAE